MASFMALRNGVASKLVKKLPVSRPVPAPLAAATATRFFNTSALHQVDGDDRAFERPSDSGHRSDFPSFRDVFDPFNSTRSLNQLLNLMNQIQMLDNVPFFSAPAGQRDASRGFRRGWDVREDEDALHLRVDMPGLGKEHVRVWSEQNTLVIQGDGENEKVGEEEASGRKYSSRIVLPPESFKMDQIKAEMKNGVLKVVVPKLKQEEGKDVFQVKFACGQSKIVSHKPLLLNCKLKSQEPLEACRIWCLLDYQFFMRTNPLLHKHFRWIA
ncbi:small heat shock protein, chloroplastic-like [Zingiber officinale]|uniref:small heat shock protein, chloroplastic-like n=1 Tax=Zingiber officinale TaxID=94328 RepID=UPI001C4B53A5|nr:small heat shock protein, chloroplastic-like [Zingiber officinale]